jgi:26S proteasome regulatory subunit T3
MADAAVENPANTVAPHKKQLPSSIPNFDSLEGFTTDSNDDYSTFKKLQRQLEYVYDNNDGIGNRWKLVANYRC